MEPISITASIVAIATAALQSTRFLAKAIDNIRDAPGIIKSISTDLRAIEPILQNLKNSVQSDSSEIMLSDQIVHAIENCNRACAAFQLQIDRWMKHSAGQKTFWMDNWKVGLFGQEKIKTFKGQLDDCKGTLTVALSTATIITMSRQGTIMKEVKDSILQQNEAGLQPRIIQAQAEAAEIDRSVQQVVAGGVGEQSSESEEIRQELLQELGRQQKSNTVYREMCEEAHAKMVYERTGQKIKGVKATNNSFALTGFINTSGEEVRIDQDISDISADNWSIVMAGVVKDVDFNDLRPGKYGGDVRAGP